MQDSSIAAYRAMPVKDLKSQADRIEAIVGKHRTVDGKGMSLKEIKDWYKFWYGDIELSSVSARVHALIAANRLERLEATRSCSISKRPIHPVRVPG